MTNEMKKLLDRLRTPGDAMTDKLRETKLLTMRDLLARALYEKVGDDFGFCLILFDDKAVTHAANVERKDLIRLMRDHADLLEKDDQVELLDVPEKE